MKFRFFVRLVELPLLYYIWIEKSSGTGNSKKLEKTQKKFKKGIDKREEVCYNNQAVNEIASQTFGNSMRLPR